jgi:hypothetical protein
MLTFIKEPHGGVFKHEYARLYVCLYVALTAA